MRGSRLFIFMFNIVLVEPEIPPNTGNIIRLCANTGSQLHLIHPLGFKIEDKHLQRAGLDYHDFACVHEYQNFEDFLKKHPTARFFAIETCGTRIYSDVHFQENDFFIFGSETKGLSQKILDHLDENHILKIPMLPNNRSLNLSNCAALVIYEAWRQLGFCTGMIPPEKMRDI